MQKNECTRCGRLLTIEDIGATKKLINRGAESFLCVECLADYLKVAPERIRQKIEDFRRAGCTLFPPKKEE